MFPKLHLGKQGPCYTPSRQDASAEASSSAVNSKIYMHLRQNRTLISFIKAEKYVKQLVLQV